MLLRETGQYLFEHTVRNLLEGGAVERVVLATDSEEIRAAAQEVGLEALMTDASHKSGTDRIHEAYENLLEAGAKAYDVVINVQGDEPDVNSEDLRELVAAFEDEQVELATLWAPFEDVREEEDENAVKVVTDSRGDALYFSRCALPSASHRRESERPRLPRKRHVGVYAFRPAALERFCSLPEGELEREESLEQLRWLEAGARLRVIAARHRPHGIDTAEDYQAFVQRQTTT